MSDCYLDKKFPEKIKEFHKYDLDYFSKLLDQTNLSITKNMHPIIAYNFPELLYKFYNESDLSNIIRSPSIMLHFEKNDMFTDKFTQTQFDICRIIKGINDKIYDTEKELESLSLIFDSKRQRATYSKAYPELHDKFETVKDNFDYNMALIALEHKDADYIKSNINFIKEKFKDRMVEVWDESFYYLSSNEFSDQDLLRFIDKLELVKFAKSESTVLKFWEYHNSTKYFAIRSLSLFNKAIEIGLDIDMIESDWLEDNAELVIKYFPYFYSELSEEKQNDKNIKHLALRDPYNISLIELNESNIKHFLNCSNIDIIEAYYGISQSGHEEKYSKMLLNEIEKFEGMFLALQSYPILMMYLTDDLYYKHVTPYLINHACKIDKDLFSFFIVKESKRWNRIS